MKHYSLYIDSIISHTPVVYRCVTNDRIYVQYALYMSVFDYIAHDSFLCKNSTNEYFCIVLNTLGASPSHAGKVEYFRGASCRSKGREYSKNAT